MAASGRTTFRSRLGKADDQLLCGSRTASIPAQPAAKRATKATNPACWLPNVLVATLMRADPNQIVTVPESA